jgi:4-hydroxybenzoate polyprenyltransferase
MEDIILINKYLKKKISSYIEIGRPSDALRPILIFILGYILVKNSIDNISILWASLSILFLSMHTVVYNDLSDYSIDKINKSKRPLQRKAISFLEAKYLSIFYFLISFIFILFNIILIHYWLFLFLIGYFYSNNKFRFSHNFFLAPLILILGNIIIPIIMGSSLSFNSYFYINQEIIKLLIMLIIMFLSIGVYKDYKDIKGDKYDNKKTLFTLFNSRKIIKIIIFLTTMSFILFLYIINSYKSLIIPIIFVLTVLLIQFSFIYSNPKIIKKRIPYLWVIYNFLIIYLIFIFLN